MGCTRSVFLRRWDENILTPLRMIELWDTDPLPKRESKADRFMINSLIDFDKQGQTTRSVIFRGLKDEFLASSSFHVKFFHKVFQFLKVSILHLFFTPFTFQKWVVPET